MPNTFQGTCYRCGKIVFPGCGTLERTGKHLHKKWPQMKDMPKWLMQHHDCAVFYRGTDQHYLYAPNAVSAEQKKRQQLELELKGGSNG